MLNCQQFNFILPILSMSFPVKTSQCATKRLPLLQDGGLLLCIPWKQLKSMLIKASCGRKLVLRAKVEWQTTDNVCLRNITNRLKTLMKKGHNPLNEDCFIDAVPVHLVKMSAGYEFVDCDKRQGKQWRVFVHRAMSVDNC